MDLIASFRRTLRYSLGRQLPNLHNDRRLRRLKDIHKGRRAFVIGNGPSLKVPDLDRLTNDIAFASNKIYLAFDRTPWRPTYLTCSDSVVAQTVGPNMAALPITKIFGHSTFPYFKRHADITYCNSPSRRTDPKDWDLIKGVSTGHSVLYWDLELAFWMGIREIYAIGVDFSFEVASKATGAKAMGNDVLAAGREVNHFHPDYRKPGELWTMPQLNKQRDEFAFALEKYRSHGGVIYNASRETKLDAWPRVDFESLFK
ncbi:MAG TPA: hypothetical protein PLX89_01995 [Verrucomicrobiota bacterium]|nr:hypothetical protein [Verrucomicrobiales bacterium]HRI11750.1 hypothetical protein [Verrucomicrobiota bacterium]